jgi:hypothetical protein
MLKQALLGICRWLELTAILLISWSGPAQEPPSLMVNGDFEQGAEAGVPGWSLQVWPEAGAPGLNGALARSNARARTGQWALRIDTQPLLGSTRTLVFNGTISGPFARLRGQRLDLSGWVYVEPDSALRPFSMVLRVWGKDQAGKTMLLGTPISASILVRLGTETRFFSPRQPLQFPGAESLYSDWVARALGFNPHSSEFEAFYQQACKAVARWAAEHGITLAFACVDEIGNSEERVQTALRYYRLAKESGVLTSVTDNSMHAGVHLLGENRFDDVIDLRVYNYITPEMIRSARDSHDGLWLYNLGSGGAKPARERFVFGFFAERCGADGYAQWAFQWPVGNQSPYAAAAASSKAGWDYALPAPDGPLPTIGLEAAHQGIDDARYVALLRRASPETASAILSDIEPYSNMIADYVERHPGSAAEIRRWKIANAVMNRKDSAPREQ